MATQAIVIKGIIKNAKPKDVWEAWIDDHRHGLMTGQRTSGSFKAVGSEFTALNGYCGGVIQRLNKPKSFAITLKTKNFPQTTEPSVVEVTLSSVKDGTEIIITNSGIPSSQVKEVEKMWNDSYFAPMNLYFDEKTFEGHVHPHEKNYTQISPNLWVIQTVFKIPPEGRIMRTMTVYKMGNGKLWIHGAAALDPIGMKELESFGEIEAIVVPCPYHRSDSNVWQKKYPNAKFYAPEGHTFSQANKITKMHGTVESMAESWAAQGITVLSPAGLKSNFELIYQLDLPNNGTALCLCDMCTNFQPNEFVPPPSGAGAYLFGTELGITRASGLPGIGFISNKTKLQNWFFDMCDKMDPRLSTFKGKTLDCLIPIHGPPVWHKSTAGQTDPLWALRYKIALGPHMPENKGASYRPIAKSDIVKAAFLNKADPEGKSFQRRFCVLTKDGRIVYASDSSGDIRGYVELLGADAQTTTIDHPFAFMILYPSAPTRRAFVFHAESHEDMTDWINKINDRANSWKEKSTNITTTSTNITTTSTNITTTSTNITTTSTTSSSATITNSSEETSVVGESDEDPMIDQVLGYWFHAIEGDDPEISMEIADFWFVRNKVVDSLIRKNFKPVWEKAIKGECDHWANTPRGLLALVILLDQFSRNMFRDTPKMYEGDEKCFEIVTKAIANGIPQKFRYHQAIWFGLPLTRKEDVSVIPQIESWYNRVLEMIKGTKNEKHFSRGYQYSKNQVDLLKRFGRYPNRNAILGRQDTPEEEAYLNSDKKYYST